MKEKREKPVILVVDDDPDFLIGLCKSLRDAEFGAISCRDGAEAIAVLQSMDADYLVTDLQMPQVDGIELLNWVRRNRPHVGTVVVTAHGGEPQRRFVLQQGALRFVEKPIDPNDLIDLFQTADQMGGFFGNLRETDILNYLELVCRSKRSLKIELLAENGPMCLLFIRKGHLIHAECNEFEGSAALEEILSVSHGTYAVHAWQDPKRRTIHEEPTFIIEALRQRERAGKSICPEV